MPSNAAIYISDPSLLGSRTLDTFPEVVSYASQSQGHVATGMMLKLAWGSITVNFMPSSQFPGHMRGFESYVRQLVDDQDTLVYVLARLNNVQMCLGCILEHSPDDEERAQEFLFRLNSNLNGLLFLYDTVFDRNAQILAVPTTS
jgi:hypothetical protein